MRHVGMATRKAIFGPFQHLRRRFGVCGRIAALFLVCALAATGTPAAKADPFAYIATDDDITIVDIGGNHQVVGTHSVALGACPVGLAAHHASASIFASSSEHKQLFEMPAQGGVASVLFSDNNAVLMETTDVAVHPANATQVYVTGIRVAQVNAIDPVTATVTWQVASTDFDGFSRVAVARNGFFVYMLGRGNVEGVPIFTEGLYRSSVGFTFTQGIPLPGADRGLALAPGSDRAYAIGRDEVHVVDTTVVNLADASVTTVPVGQAGPGEQLVGGAINHAGTRLYLLFKQASPRQDFVKILDTGTLTLIGSGIPIPRIGWDQPGIAVSPNDRFVYVVHADSMTASVIDPATQSVIQTVSLSSPPCDVAFAELPQGCGPADGDGDFVPDCVDNCTTISNAGQQDQDDDGIGDACDRCPADANDNDDDGDGICTTDNCPNTPNPNQADTDGDGIGDACDLDSDGDGIFDDGDGSGTVGDNSCSGGATSDCDDNCRFTPNPDQADRDQDGVGDVCDNCPDAANADQRDNDNDGLGDACDCDDDNDNVIDADPACGVGPYDNCTWVWNPGQEDFDQDGLGYRCDPTERYRFKTGKLWYDAKLEALATLLEKGDIFAPWQPPGPGPCPYRCMGLMQGAYEQGLKDAKRYLDEEFEGDEFTREDLMKYFLGMSDLPEERSIFEAMLKHAWPPPRSVKGDLPR